MAPVLRESALRHSVTPTIGASIGLAMNTVDMPDEKAWLESADKACYDAKRQGRGLLRIATRLQGGELPTCRVDS
jgi:GGDEF domain-containing protein